MTAKIELRLETDASVEATGHQVGGVVVPLSHASWLDRTLAGDPVWTPTVFQKYPWSSALVREIEKLRTRSRGHEGRGKQSRFHVDYLLANLMLVRNATRECLDVHEPKAVWLCTSPVPKSSSHTKLNDALFLLSIEQVREVLREYFEQDSTDAYSIRTLSEVLRNSPKHRPWTKSILRLAFRIAGSLDVRSERFVYGARNRKVQVSRWVKRKNVQHGDVLLYAQWRKVTHLFSLQRHGLVVRYLPYVTTTERPVDLIKTAADIDEESVLERTAQIELSEDERSLKSDLISRTSLLQPGYFVSDAQHDSQVGEAMVALRDLGWHNAFIPEGAVAYLGERSLGRWSLTSQEGQAHHFVVNEVHKAELIEEGTPPDEVSVSGFLGEPSGVLTKALGQALCSVGTAAKASRREAGVSLLVADVFATDSWVKRPGQFPAAYSYDLHARTILQLLEHSDLVLVATRTPNLWRYIEKSFPSKKVKDISPFPWTSVISMCDEVATASSSVGLEAIAKGFPVITWRDEGTPGFVEATMGGPAEPWLWVAPSIDLISDYVSRSRASLEERRKTPRAFGSAAPESVLHWIKGWS